MYSNYKFAFIRHLAATVSKKSELREEAVEALANELRAAAENALLPGGSRFLPLRCRAHCNCLAFDYFIHIFLADLYFSCSHFSYSLLEFFYYYWWYYLRRGAILGEPMHNFNFNTLMPLNTMPHDAEPTLLEEISPTTADGHVLICFMTLLLQIMGALHILTSIRVFRLRECIYNILE